MVLVGYYQVKELEENLKKSKNNESDEMSYDYFLVDGFFVFFIY